MNHFSKNLRFLRELRKLRLDDFETLGIKKGTMSNYELGKTEPKFETLQALARFFEISLDKLINSDLLAPQIPDNTTANGERPYDIGQTNSISTDNMPAYKAERTYNQQKKGVNRTSYPQTESQVASMDFMRLVLDNLDQKNTQFTTILGQFQRLETRVAELEARIAQLESELYSLKN